MTTAAFAEVNQLLAHVEHHELQLWSLIDAQHELKSRIRELHNGFNVESHSMTHPLEYLASLMGQYEARTWQILPIQLQLRLKLIEFGDCGSNSMIKQEHLAPAKDGLDESTTEMPDIKASGDPPASIVYLARSNVEQVLEESTNYLGSSHRRKSSASDEALTAPHTKRRREVKRPFPCPDCEKSFDRRANLTKHRRVHGGEEPLKCTLCDASFRTSNGIYFHKQKHIKAGERFDEVLHTCRLCQQQFKRIEWLKRHFIDSHAGAKPFACDQCNEEFNATARLNTHIIIKHGGERPFGCDICQRRFADKTNFKKHVDTHRDVRFECNICGKSMKSLEYLRTHMKFLHTNVELCRQFLCDECGKGFRCKSSLENHLRIHSGERPFACTQCAYKCAHLSYMKSHMATHSSVRRFKCAECDKPFITKDALYKHTRNLHSKNRPFECTLCDKRFAVNGELQLHLARHGGAKPHACADCGEHFRTYSQRALHVKKVHTGELRFQCDICRERFVIKTQLSAHMIKHTGVKPFPCDQCGKRFNRAGALKSHQQINHSDQPPVFKCDICQIEFRSLAVLERHKRSHTGEKPFSCDVCQKTFADSHSVTVHMRLHTGEMPFACYICDRRFRDKRNLGKHTKIHDK